MRMFLSYETVRRRCRASQRARGGGPGRNAGHLDEVIRSQGERALSGARSIRMASCPNGFRSCDQGG
jgi:hypothetical protein